VTFGLYAACALSYAFDHGLSRYLSGYRPSSFKP
jgi:hypothetical protein